MTNITKPYQQEVNGLNKEFLTETHEINKRVKRLYEKLDLIRSQKTAIKSVDTEAERVNGGNKSNYNLERLLDEEKYYNELLREENQLLNENLDKIKQKIKEINDWEIEEVMIYRYIYFYPWELIRFTCNLSDSDMFRKHRLGLKSILK